MIDEANTSEETAWYLENLGRKAVKALVANNFEAEFVPDRREALARVLERIPAEASIGNGDSVTLHQIGFFEWLEHQEGHEVFNPFSVMSKDFPNDWVAFRKARLKLQRKAFVADVFLTSANALTVDGKLVSIDAHGNRVAAMCFGPGRVIFVVGANKIVDNVDEAVKRVHEIAAPINARRHVLKHGSTAFAELPCTLTGSCAYCRNPKRICRITVIIDGWSPTSHTPGVELPPLVIVVGEALGI